MAKNQAAELAAEETQAENVETVEQTEGTEQGETVEQNTAEQLLTHAKEYRKAYRSLGGRGDKIEDAEKDAAEARKKIAASVDDPEAMQEAIKEMRKAEARIARMSGTDTKAQEKAVAALDKLIEVAQAERAELTK